MKRFSLNIALRILLLIILSMAILYCFQNDQEALGVICFLLLVSIGFSLHAYTTAVNKKLTLFFESVQYSDFTVKFSSDNKLGKSFKDLNEQMNLVVDAFKAARAEKEANFHYLNTLVQHVDVGIICYDAKEKIEIINNAAIRMLEVFRLRNLDDLLKTEQEELYALVKELPGKGRLMYETKRGMQLAITMTNVNLRGRSVRIVSFQNIRTELQEKEVNAWQNLTKVLRHEIMNSIAPIVSLVGTMRNIVTEDLGNKPEIREPVEDLELALETIESRGMGIMNFVNAYRDFTTLPKPHFQNVSAAELLKHLMALNQEEAVTFDFANDFIINCDRAQIEMVLLNLIKNGIESIFSKELGYIHVTSLVVNNTRIIEVKDNGSGIDPEAIEKIFIPFYTTKRSGSGIGLSLSKQIMQMHNGDLVVKSVVGEGSVFRLLFH